MVMLMLMSSGRFALSRKVKGSKYFCCIMSQMGLVS